MTTPSGEISLSNVANEFNPFMVGSGQVNGKPGGASGEVRLGSYRKVTYHAGTNWPLDDGIPTSGQISLGQLRNKRLNVIVDYTGTQYGVNSSDAYSNGRMLSVNDAGLVGKASVGKKVRHIIRGTIGGGGKLVTGISPTQPVLLNNFQLNSPQNFIGGNVANTLGEFQSSSQVIPPSQFGNYPGGRYCPVINARTCPRTIPPTTGMTTLIDTTTDVSLSGGTVISLRKVQRRYIWFTSNNYYTKTLVYYQVNSIKTQGNASSSTISGSYDGRTFTFDVTSSANEPAFRTGTGWNGGDQLLYYIQSNAGIYGTGGNGGRAGQNCDYPPGTNGGTAFEANYTCSIIMGGGYIGGGGGGGGGGSFLYYNDGDQDDRIHGGGGGGGAGLSGGDGGTYLSTCIQNGNGPEGGTSNASAGGGGVSPTNYMGYSGKQGSLTGGGSGGAGANRDGINKGGNGGNGGNLGQDGTRGNGFTLRGVYYPNNTNNAGSAGAAIIKNGNSVTTTGDTTKIIGQQI